MADLAHANRGNVAVICWNTLNSKTWYVTSEKLDGEVSLGQEGTQTLLAINFADFTTTEGEFKEIEDIDITKENIDDRQLKLASSVFGTTEEVKTFDFDKKPSKNKDEKSYKDGSTVMIYVPEEVCEDLDELRNKTITLILGTDNEAALILVQDDVAEKDLLTKYANNKVTIGGTEYKLASSYDITLNDVDVSTKYVLTDDTTATSGKSYYKSENSVYKKVESTSNPHDEGLYEIVNADLDDALTTILGAGYDNKNIEKAIEATVTLDEDDKVETIELFTSANLDNTVEVLVTKVKESKSTYTIYTTGKTITWNIDDEDDLDFPKVYVDGKKADIRDIEAGNVLTIIEEEDASEIEYNGNEISKIYASTKVVTGEATKVKKSNNAITIDGEVYMATSTSVKMSTDELKDNKFDKDFKAQDVLDNDEVTLYLNMFGEYVAIVLDEADTNYTFGVVTFVSSNITWAGDDEEIAVRNFKVLLPDGTKKTYKLTVNTDDKDISNTTKNMVQKEDKVPFKTEQFVMFEANSNNEIELEDGDEVTVLSSSTAEGKIGTTDYVLAKPVANSVDKDDAEFKFNTDKDGEYDAKSTVIFNTAEKELVTRWKSIVVDGSTQGKYSLAAKTFMIFEDEDDDIPMYIVVNIPEDDYSASDAVYAIVDNSAYREGDEWYVDFVGSENIEVKAGQPVETLTKIDGWFVEYAMSSSKISEAYKLIDVEEFQSKDTKDSTLLNTLIATNAAKQVVTTTINSADLAIDDVTDATFINKVTNDGAYTFTYNGTDWELDGSTVTLAEYGISVTGNVEENDTITVTVKTYKADTEIAWGTKKPTKVEQIELDEVKITSTGKITLKFVEIGANDEAISDVKLDKDEIKVYDLRNGKVELVDITDIQTEVADGESVYVVPAHNSDVDDPATDGQNLLFIVK